MGIYIYRWWRILYAPASSSVACLDQLGTTCSIAVAMTATAKSAYPIVVHSAYRAFYEFQRRLSASCLFRRT
jgi:hypothetical protein